MIELTRYQREWVQNNQLNSRITLKKVLTCLVTIGITIAYLFLKDNPNVSEGLVNLLLFGIFAYITLEFVFTVLNLFGLGTLKVSDKLFSIARRQIQENSHAHYIEQEAQEEFDKLVKLKSDLYSKLYQRNLISFRDKQYYPILALDYITDIFLLCTLVFTGSYVLGAIHLLLCLVSYWCSSRIQVLEIRFIKNLTPVDDDDNDNIDDLADKLFHDTDLL